ncbi:MAG: LamG domain-containing protein [Lentisphaeria bacterium]
MLKRIFTVVVCFTTLFSFCLAEEGLVGCWPLNEANETIIKDAGSNQLDGVLVEPDIIAWREGRNGKAIDFRGVNGTAPYLRVDGINKFELTKGMTVMCWYSPDADQKYGHQGVIVSNGRTGASEGFRLLLHYHRILLGNGKLTNYAATTPGKHPLQPGVWVHIAATHDGDNTFQVFIDGELAGTGSGPLGNGIDSLAIGSEFGYRPALAAISDVKLYSRKLSAAEIITAARKE